MSLRILSAQSSVALWKTVHVEARSPCQARLPLSVRPPRPCFFQTSVSKAKFSVSNKPRLTRQRHRNIRDKKRPGRREPAVGSEGGFPPNELMTAIINEKKMMYHRMRDCSPHPDRLPCLRRGCKLPKMVRPVLSSHGLGAGNSQFKKMQDGRYGAPAHDPQKATQEFPARGDSLTPCFDASHAGDEHGHR